MDYYNDIEPFACKWMEQLIEAREIPAGKVDGRSIADIRPNELLGYRRCHFFAGIGGWAYALRLAGWPEDWPVWSGSCPCQPYSTAGKREGNNDARDLWPVWLPLIREYLPGVIFGEQVEGAIGFGWLDRICRDLEKEGYAVGYAVLGAHSVNAPHIRQRLYWMAKSGRQQGRERYRSDKIGGWPNGAEQAGMGGRDGGVSNASGEGLPERIGIRGIQSNAVEPFQGEAVERHCNDSRMEYAAYAEKARQQQQPEYIPGSPNYWEEYEIVHCGDGKRRRIKPGISPLAYGIPARVGKLRGYGNAIVPQVAAAFIKAFMSI